RPPPADAAERGVDARDSPTVVVRRPHLAEAVNSYARRALADRDSADVGAVVFEMSDRARVERMCDPEVVVAIDDAALRPGRALPVRGDERAVGSELAHGPIAIRGVKDVALAVDAKAVAGVAVAAPVDAVG